jgi:O-antigen/teichoic acid export membrane protein
MVCYSFLVRLLHPLLSAGFDRRFHGVPGIPPRFRRIGRECLWIAIGQAAATLGALVGVRLLTSVLPPETYGELALGLTLATLANQIVMGPLSSAALRFFAPAREAGQLTVYFASLRQLIAGATIVVLSIAGVLCFVLLSTGHVAWLWLGMGAIVFSLLSGYNSTLNGVQNAARQRSIVAWHQALASWLRYLSAIGLIMLFGTSSAFVMVGYALAMLLVLFSQYRCFKRVLPPRSQLSSIEASLLHRRTAEILTYAWPFAVWGVFTFAQTTSDRWALQAFTCTRDVGLYSVIYQLGYYPITILQGLMTDLMAPLFFERAGDSSDAGRMRHVHTMNWVLIVTGLLFTLAAVLFASIMHTSVFRWLTAPEYWNISWLLPAMVLAGGLFAVGQFSVLSLLSCNETHTLMVPKIGTAVLGILLNIFGAAWLGISGVVGAGVLTSLTYLLWILCLVRVQHNRLTSDGSSPHRNRVAALLFGGICFI